MCLYMKRNVTGFVILQLNASFRRDKKKQISQ
jgi:hypothetical protein